MTKSGRRVQTASIARKFPLLMVGLLLFVLVACANSQSGDMRSTTWEVVGFRIPGISAMSFEEALAFEGRSLAFGPKQAISGSDTCDMPLYTTTQEPAEEFLASEYKIRPQDVGLRLPDEATLEVMRITCEGQLWPTIGGIILWDGNERGYAIYDGVFFDIEPTG